MTVKATPSERPGEYEINLPPLDAGSYNLAATVAVNGANLNPGFGTLTLEAPKPAAIAGREGTTSGLLWLAGLGVLLLLVSAFFLVWRRRAVLQPEA